MKGKEHIGNVIFYLLVMGIFIAGTCLGSMATATVAQLIPLERAHTVIIDAGHGGVDGGAVSCTGSPESQYNLEISLRLRDLFHLLGYQTRMIRTEDISIYTQDGSIAQKKISDLKERVRIVNETENGLLISIHQNTFSDSRYTGAQVFYAPEGEGQTLARDLQQAFCATVNPGSNRKAKQAAGVYLMQNIQCTGILVECGFLSSPQEEAKLGSPEYQQKLCVVIAATVGDFLSNT